MAMYVQTAEGWAGAVGSSRRQVNPGSKVGRSRAALATGGASTGSAGNGGSSMSASTALAKKEKKWDKWSSGSWPRREEELASAAGVLDPGGE